MFGESQRPKLQSPKTYSPKTYAPTSQWPMSDGPMSDGPMSSVPGGRATKPRHDAADMKSFQDGAYAMAALSATVVAFRLLLKKGLLTREEAVRNLLDEAVQRAIFAESVHEATSGRSTAELNRQSAEILKFIAESL
jgi:hypothetical protein